MEIQIMQNHAELGKVAGESAAQFIRNAIRERDIANIVLATGISQFETLNHLIEEKRIDWSKVVMFHLDEYIGLPVTHPASFRKYLGDRFINKLPPLKAVHLINGETDPQTECARLGNLISLHPIDVTLAGIGENSHLAFNDPPADFETVEAFIVVELDEACRRQQLGEGWFSSMEEVPRKAISMSIRQIMKANQVICSVPDSRKAIAIKNCFENPVSNLYPASILQLHPRCICYLDKDSSSLLSPNIPYIRHN
jgi:glucosamine-6-phosphate deaminase